MTGKQTHYQSEDLGSIFHFNTTRLMTPTVFDSHFLKYALDQSFEAISIKPSMLLSRPLFVLWQSTHIVYICACLCRPFKCEVCGQRYYRKNVLKAHLVKCRARQTQRRQGDLEESELASDASQSLDDDQDDN